MTDTPELMPCPTEAVEADARAMRELYRSQGIVRTWQEQATAALAQARGGV